METACLGVILGIAVICISTFITNDFEVWILAASVGFCWSIIGILVSFLRGSGSLIVSQICDGVVVYVVPLVLCVGVVIARGDLTIEVILVSYVVSALMSLACLCIVGLRMPRGTVNSGHDRLDIPIERQLARRLWWNQVFSAISSRAPVLLAAPLAGVPATAIIEAGLRTQLVGATLAWAGGTVASPRYAVAHHNRHYRRSNGSRLLSAVTWAAVLPSAGLAIVLVFWGEPILGLLGRPFSDARWAITLMAIAAVVELPGATGGYYLMMTGRERVASVSTLAQLLVMLAGALATAPVLGAFGIACAVLTATFVRTVVVLAGLRRHGVSSPLSSRGIVLIVSKSSMLFR